MNTTVTTQGDSSLYSRGVEEFLSKYPKRAQEALRKKPNTIVNLMVEQAITDQSRGDSTVQSREYLEGQIRKDLYYEAAQEESTSAQEESTPAPTSPSADTQPPVVTNQRGISLASREHMDKLYGDTGLDSNIFTKAWEFGTNQVVDPLVDTGVDIARAVPRGLARGGIRILNLGKKVTDGTLELLTSQATGSAKLDEDFILDNFPIASGGSASEVLEGFVPRVAIIKELYRAIPALATHKGLTQSLGTLGSKLEAPVNMVTSFLGTSSTARYITMGGTPQVLVGRPENLGSSLDLPEYVSKSLGLMDEDQTWGLAERFHKWGTSGGVSREAFASFLEDLGMTVALSALGSMDKSITKGLADKVFKPIVKSSQNIIRGMSKTYASEMDTIRQAMESAQRTNEVINKIITKDIPSAPKDIPSAPKDIPAPKATEVAKATKVADATPKVEPMDEPLFLPKEEALKPIKKTAKVAAKAQAKAQAPTSEDPLFIPKKPKAKTSPKAQTPPKAKTAAAASKESPLISRIISGETPLRASTLTDYLKETGSFVDPKTGDTIISKWHNFQHNKPNVLDIKRTVSGTRLSTSIEFGSGGKAQTLADVFLRTNKPDPVLKELVLTHYGMSEKEALAFLKPMADNLVKAGVLEKSSTGYLLSKNLPDKSVWKVQADNSVARDTTATVADLRSESLIRAIAGSNRKGAIDPKVFTELGMLAVETPWLIGASMMAAHVGIPGVEFEAEDYLMAIGISWGMRAGHRFISDTLNSLDTPTVKSIAKTAADSVGALSDAVARLPSESGGNNLSLKVMDAIRRNSDTDEFREAYASIIRQSAAPSSLATPKGAINHIGELIAKQKAAPITKGGGGGSLSMEAFDTWANSIGLDKSYYVDTFGQESLSGIKNSVTGLLGTLAEDLKTAKNPGDVVAILAKGQLLEQTLRDPRKALNVDSDILSEGVAYGSIMKAVAQGSKQDFTTSGGSSLLRETSVAAENLVRMCQNLSETGKGSMFLDFIRDTQIEKPWDDMANQLRYFMLLSDPTLPTQTITGFVAHGAHKLITEATKGVGAWGYSKYDLDYTQVSRSSSAFFSGMLGSSLDGFGRNILDSIQLAKDSVRLGRNIMDPTSRSFMMRFSTDATSIANNLGMVGPNSKDVGRALWDNISKSFGFNQMDMMRGSEVFFQSMFHRGFIAQARSEAANKLVAGGQASSYAEALRMATNNPGISKDVAKTALSRSRTMIFKEMPKVAGTDAMGSPIREAGAGTIGTAFENVINQNTNGWISKVLNPIFATGARATMSSWRESPLGALAEYISYASRRGGKQALSSVGLVTDREIKAQVGARVCSGIMLATGVGTLMGKLGYKYVSRTSQVDAEDKRNMIRAGAFLNKSTGEPLNVQRTGAFGILAAMGEAYNIATGFSSADEETLERLDMDSRNTVGAFLGAIGTMFHSLDVVGLGEALRNYTSIYQGTTGGGRETSRGLEKFTEDIYQNIISQVSPTVINMVLESARGVSTLSPRTLDELVNPSKRLPVFGLHGGPLDNVKLKAGGDPSNILKDYIIGRREKQSPESPQSNVSLSDLMVRAGVDVYRAANGTPSIGGKSLRDDREALFEYRANHNRFMTKYHDVIYQELRDSGNKYTLEAQANKWLTKARAYAISGGDSPENSKVVAFSMRVAKEDAEETIAQAKTPTRTRVRSVPGADRLMKGLER